MRPAAGEQPPGEAAQEGRSGLPTTRGGEEQQDLGAVEILRRDHQGDVRQETRGLRLAVLQTRGRGGAGAARLLRHHQTPHGSEHHQGKSDIRDGQTDKTTQSIQNNPVII